MKKINTYSAQFKIIQSHKNNPNPRRFANKNPRSFANKSPNKKKLSKDRQKFTKNIAASGFKQLHA